MDPIPRENFAVDSVPEISLGSFVAEEDRTPSTETSSQTTVQLLYLRQTTGYCAAPVPKTDYRLLLQATVQLLYLRQTTGYCAAPVVFRALMPGAVWAARRGNVSKCHGDEADSGCQGYGDKGLTSANQRQDQARPCTGGRFTT
ncbi:hypothetical protein Bbelb_229060 [Branchiostoma belcheri]|nr:hypothetical protein Bbelb_229060 [Branchiostoma belcheri]